jgi:hypothetical protein
VALQYDFPFEYVEGDGDNAEVKVECRPLADPTRVWPERQIQRWQQSYAAGAAAETFVFGTDRPYGCPRDAEHHDKLENLRQSCRDEPNPPWGNTVAVLC